MQIIFNPLNWYWAVGGSSAQVYSSARNIYVSVNDAEFSNWLTASSGAATKIGTEAEIWPYVASIVPAWMFDGETFAQPTATTYSRAQMKACAASLRFDKETGGMTVNGVALATDRQSQAMINGAYNMASRDSTFTTKWKGVDGKFASLDAPTIIAIATAIGQHVAACFAKEADVVAQIDAGTLISIPEINAAFASIA